MKSKPLILIAALMLSASAVFAQGKSHMWKMATMTSSDFADTVVVDMAGMEKVIVMERNSDGKVKKVGMYKRYKESVFTYNLMFDIGFNSYASHNIFTGSDGDDFLDLNTSESVNVAIYPIGGTIRLTKNHRLNLQTGLGIDWGNYRFEDGWTIANENGQTVASDKYRENGESLVSKSKLMTAYMNVPLILQLNIPVGRNERGFYLGAGVIGGLKLGSHTKVKYSDNDDKVKDHSSFNLNLLRADLTFRAGYNGLGLFFNYQLSSMFEDGQGPKLFPYSAGVSVTM